MRIVICPRGIQRGKSASKVVNIAASVDPNNTKSIRLLEKLGMRKEGHFIKSYRRGDMWLDDCIYAILEEVVTGMEGYFSPIKITMDSTKKDCYFRY